MRYFYEMYPCAQNRPQAVDELVAEDKCPQVVDDLIVTYRIPWGHSSENWN
jgi:hypothetical protein